MSIMDRQLLRQKVRQKISVINFCFCCLQDKTWIKMPKWTIFVISSQVFVLITEIFDELFDVIIDDT